MSSDGKYISHLTPETIREYLGGRLDSATMHRIETHLLECEFCADAVEGFELSERSHVKTDVTLLALRKKLNQKIKEHERPAMMRWPAWSAAAGIALAIAGYVVIKQQETEQKLLAIQQSEAFLQTGINDTLIIFMPEGPPPLHPEGLLASNTGYIPTPGELQAAPSEQQAMPGEQQTMPGEQQTAVRERYVVPGERQAAAGEQEEAVPGERQAAAEGGNQMRERAIDSPLTENALAKSLDSLSAENVVVVAVGTQRKSRVVGSVYIRGIKQDTPANGMKIVRGRVVAGDTTSLPGVAIQVEGTTKATSTDRLGNFELEMPEGENSLVMSLIGFQTDTVRVAEHADNLLLALQPAEAALNEKVIVGYPRSKKAEQVPNAGQVSPTGQVSPAPAIGKAAYKKYLSDSLRYPQEALKKQIEGEVTVRFTVRASGRPAAFKIIRSLSESCDKEAIRLIKEGPDWVSPVVKRGRPQPADAVQTIKFELPAG